MCPITGISASTMASTTGRRLRPPSSLTAWAPAPTRAAALRAASSTAVEELIHARAAPRPALAAALELHRLGPCPHQGGGVAHGVVHRRVVAHPRQVAHHQRPGPLGGGVGEPPAHGAGGGGR